MPFTRLAAPDGDMRLGLLRHVFLGKSASEPYEDYWWRYDDAMDDKPLDQCLPSVFSIFEEWVMPFYREMVVFKQTGIKSDLLTKIDALCQACTAIIKRKFQVRKLKKVFFRG